VETNEQSIADALQLFAARPGCQSYASVKKQVALLTDYLWLRNLSPTLTFEVFLDCYAKVADFDEANLKHPKDAVKVLLPSKSEAGETYNQQDVVTLLSTYVDMVRSAELANTPVPVTLAQFLQTPAILQAFRNGDFDTVKQPVNKKSKKPAPAVNNIPTSEGERCIFTAEEAREHRGTLLYADISSNSAVVQADSGEVHSNVMLTALRKCNDPVRKGYTDDHGVPLPIGGKGRKFIPKPEYERILQLQALKIAVGVTPIGSPLYSYEILFPEKEAKALIEVINDAPLYVDARLTSIHNNDEVYFEVEPRQNLLGDYEFVHMSEVYSVRLLSPAADDPEQLPTTPVQFSVPTA